MNKYWQEVLKLAQKAQKKGEVPVGAIIVYNSMIIAKGYNKREGKHDILGHAEIECIKKANKCLHNWKLSECEMYVSLKPCSMCEAIIRQSRLKAVHYLLEKDEKKHEYAKTTFIKEENLEYANNFKYVLNNFFKKMR